MADSKDSWSDSELVEACYRGDDEAFAILYEKYRGAVRKKIYSIVHNQLDSDDLSTKTFLKILHSFREKKELKDSRKFGRWAVSIARNVAYDHFRSTGVKIDKRGKEIANDHPIRGKFFWDGDRQAPDNRLLEEEAKRITKEWWQALDDDHQDIIKLRLEGLTQEKIAIRCGKSQAVVSRAITEIVRPLRERLKGYKITAAIFDNLDDSK